MKAAVVAKLSVQTSLYFENVKKSLVTEPLSTTLYPSWKHHVEYPHYALVPDYAINAHIKLKLFG